MKKKIILKNGLKILTHAYFYVYEGVNDKCPVCNYDYSEINYTELSKRFSFMVKNIGNEPVVDWFFEYWTDEEKKEHIVEESKNERENKPYKVKCLNGFDHWITFDPKIGKFVK